MVSAVALAAPGDLTPQGCVEDTDMGPDACAQDAAGLEDASAVVPSPDGQSLYASSQTDNAIVRLTRAPDGAITPQGCLDDNDSGPDTCAQDADGLDAAVALAISADGTSLYSAAVGDDAIAAFDRAANGALTPLGCVDDNDTGTDNCAQNADGLNGPRAVALSPDGTSLYVAADEDDSIAWFDRDPATGILTPQGCVDDNDTGTDNCAQDTDGLDAPQAVVVSPDGESVYVGSNTDQAVVRFDRNTMTGALTPQGCVQDDDTSPENCAQDTDGMNIVAAVSVSPDGGSVYAGSTNDDAIVRFARDPGTGAITPQDCVDDNDSGVDACAQSSDGLNSVNSFAFSSDGQSLYVGAANDDAVARFARNPATGALTPLGCIHDNDSGTDACAQSADGLQGARSVAITADDSSLYAAGRFDNAIVRFDREVPVPPGAPPAAPGDAFPPDTGIRKGPKRKTPKRKAKFEFGGSEPGVTFECRLDVDSRQGAFEPCTSPLKIKGLKRKTKYVFAVRAVDVAGNPDPTPADRRWKVTKKKRK